MLEVVLLATALHAGRLRPPLPRGVRCRAPLAVAEDTPAGLSDEPQTVDIYGRVLACDTDPEDADCVPSEPVVKVYSVHSSQNPMMPWSNKAQEESTGSGFSIRHDGRLCVLTNAHVVADATYVEVRKAGDARKYVATRVKLSHECDLATLSVEDDRFWEGVEPLSFGSMPSLQDEVAVVGYPEGGEGVSITQGVVSRIEIQRYVHSGTSLLAIQIDAAINPGNSGGPAIDASGDVIGVAFQNQQESQNIGYVIPVPTIHHFLEDSKPGLPQECAGFCSLGIFWQALENPQLHEQLGMGERSGVLIRGVLPLSECARRDLVQRDDILLAIDGQPIADDGTFAVGQQERLSFQHLIHLKFDGQTVRLRLLRGGDELTVDVPVHPQHRMVPTTTYDVPQSYFLYGGFVFVPLTEPYLMEWGEDWMQDAPHDLVNLALSGIATLDEEQPIILTRIFPSKCTAGYSGMTDRRVLSVNREPVRNLKQMYSLVERLHRTQSYLSFELQCVGGNAVVALDSASADAVRDEILATYRIPFAASPDLLASADE